MFSGDLANRETQITQFSNGKRAVIVLIDNFPQRRGYLNRRLCKYLRFPTVYFIIIFFSIFNDEKKNCISFKDYIL